MSKGKVNAVFGLQYGDEGKGRVVDFLAKEHEVVARFNGGPNAGHTIVKDGQEFKIHQVPSGILSPGILNVIGNGSYVNPHLLMQEIQDLEKLGIDVSPENLIVSSLAHLILPHHIQLDTHRESTTKKQGSTKNGIAQTASDKYLRTGVRAETIKNPDKMFELVVRGLKDVNDIRKLQRQQQLFYIDRIAEDWLEQSLKIDRYLGDTVDILHSRLEDGQNALAEGAQSIGLDIELGPYPYGSSSHTGAGGVLSGLSINHKQMGEVTGVVKAIKSKVGQAPFVTEVREDEDPELVSVLRGDRHAIDSEYGTTTGRPRSVGHLDLPELRSAIRTSGVEKLALTKLDHLTRFGAVALIAVAYQDNETGDRYQYAPSSPEVLDRCSPIYQRLPLWDKEVGISSTKKYSELPPQARHFIDFLEEDLNLPVEYIGVGPSHEQLLTKS